MKCAEWIYCPKCGAKMERIQELQTNHCPNECVRFLVYQKKGLPIGGSTFSIESKGSIRSKATEQEESK